MFFPCLCDFCVVREQTEDFILLSLLTCTDTEFLIRQQNPTDASFICPTLYDKSVWCDYIHNFFFGICFLCGLQ